MSDLIVPSFEAVRFEIGEVRKSDFRRELERAYDHRGDGIVPAAADLLGLQLGSKSDYLEGKDVAHNTGKTAFTFITTFALALLTVVPTDASTGASITEANYTGYARKVVPAASLTNAEGTSPTKITNNVELIWPNCTAGSSTIVALAALDSSTIGAGNIHYWMTVTSAVISTTQTPPSIAASLLEFSED